MNSTPSTSQGKVSSMKNEHHSSPDYSLCTARLENPVTNYRLLLQLSASRQPEPPAALDWLAVKNLDNLNRWKIKWAMR